MWNLYARLFTLLDRILPIDVADWTCSWTSSQTKKDHQEDETCPAIAQKNMVVKPQSTSTDVLEASLLTSACNPIRPSTTTTATATTTAQNDTDTKATAWHQKKFNQAQLQSKFPLQRAGVLSQRAKSLLKRQMLKERVQVTRNQPQQQQQGSTQTHFRSPSTSRIVSVATDARHREPLVTNDPYHLQRFIEPHQEHFDIALQEIQTGRKQSHWSWYFLVTPARYINGQMQGSLKNRYFSIKSEAEAVAFLRFPTIDGVNLRRNSMAILQALHEQLVRGETLHTVLAHDAPRAVSSVKLFHYVADRISDDELCQLCRAILGCVEAHET